MLIVLNAHHDLVEFSLPAFEGGTHWTLELDTNIGDGAVQFSGGPADRYGMTGRSLAVFIGAATPAG
jgi:glycogen operon protein